MEEKTQKQNVIKDKGKNMKKIGTSDLVRRQTKESRFTHYNGTWEELENLVEEHFENQTEGYRDGVILVSVPADGFFKVGPYIEGRTYSFVFAPRQEGEKPVKQVINNDEKIPCKFVDVVLYRHDVLAEDNDRTTEAEWEIVSVNGKDSDIEEPIPPMAMARNFLHLKGGTKADYTAEEFAKSIVYWMSRG